MSITEATTITSAPSAPSATARLQPVTFDLYRDIHKGIRRELFAVTVAAGQTDPADDVAAAAIEAEVRAVVSLLVDHAKHEDHHIQAPLFECAPALAERVERDHLVLEARMDQLVELAGEARASAASQRRFALHELYLELGSFVGAYLVHQDVEEREIMPALEQALGVEAVMGIHGAIIGTMPPQELMTGLAVIFPAGNVDDRTEMLGGMRAGAPAEVFEAIWGLACSVLAPEDSRAVARRLGL